MGNSYEIPTEKRYLRYTVRGLGANTLPLVQKVSDGLIDRPEYTPRRSEVEHRKGQYILIVPYADKTNDSGKKHDDTPHDPVLKLIRESLEELGINRTVTVIPTDALQVIPTDTSHLDDFFRTA